MKPIRDYNDGQWLLLLWAFVILFIVAGLVISSRLVLVVAILGALTAMYTTYLYVAERTGRSPTGSIFRRRTGGVPRSDADAPRETEHHEGGSA